MKPTIAKKSTILLDQASMAYSEYKISEDSN